MMQRTGTVTIAEASRHMQRLCYHFSRKIAATSDEREGLAQFPWGRCAMRADDSRIDFRCEAATREELDRVQHVIDEHVKLFTRRTPVQVAWDEAVETG